MTKNKKLIWLMLIIGCIAFYFSGSITNAAITAFIWPLCFMYFIHNHKKPVGLLITFICYEVIFNVVYFYALGIESASQAIEYNTIYALASFVPFIVDGLLHDKINKKLSVLVFPLAIAVVEFLISLSHLTLMNNLAYTQVNVLPFIQIADVVGTFGVSAIIACFASVACYVMESDFKWNDVKRVVIAYVCMMLVVTVYGSVKLAYNDNYGKDTVKVAMALGPELVYVDGEWVNVSYDENVASMKNSFKKAYASDASIIAFNEEAFCVADSEEESFIEEIKALTVKYHMYGLVCIENYDTDDSEGGKGCNKLVFVDPDGEVLVNYTKSILVPVLESPYYVKGDGNLPVADVTVNDTTFKVSMDVCYDGDFSQYIRTMDNDVAIWFEPCWEWEPVYQYHTSSHFLRAIENGVNMVKPTYEGYSYVCDKAGNILACSNYSTENITIAEVPVTGSKTVYGAIGNIINYGYIVLLAVVIILGFKVKD